MIVKVVCSYGDRNVLKMIFFFLNILDVISKVFSAGQFFYHGFESIFEQYT